MPQDYKVIVTDGGIYMSDIVNVISDDRYKTVEIWNKNLQECH